MNKMKRPKRKALGGAGKCAVCGQPLGKSGGYGETGLCGPCATGEAETLSERGDTW